MSGPPGPLATCSYSCWHIPPPVMPSQLHVRPSCKFTQETCLKPELLLFWFVGFLFCLFCFVWLVLLVLVFSWLVGFLVGLFFAFLGFWFFGQARLLLFISQQSHTDGLVSAAEDWQQREKQNHLQTQAFPTVELQSEVQTKQGPV